MALFRTQEERVPHMNRDALVLLIPLAGVFFGSLVVLIPIAGLTARFALKPVLEATRAHREGQGGASAREVAELKQRIDALEQQQQYLLSSVERLSEVQDFERRLGADPSIS
jgi:hypothetical protein